MTIEAVDPIVLGVIEPEATLRECEQLFAAGEQAEKRGQIAQAVALRHIRDNRLYLERHATFGEYVEKRLGYSAGWASQRIALADVAEQFTNVNVPAIVNEGQARAIAPVIKEHGVEVAAEVLREAADDDGNLTARAITEAVPTVVPAAPVVTEPPPLPDPPPPIDDDKQRHEAWLAQEKRRTTNRDFNAHVWLLSAFGQYPNRLEELLDLWDPSLQPYPTTPQTFAYAIAGLEAVAAHMEKTA